MAYSLLPEIVIVVSGTHWQCITCKLDQKRTVSLDEHLTHSHPYIPLCSPQSPVPVGQILSDGEETENTEKENHVAVRPGAKTQKPQVSLWLRKPDFEDSSEGADKIDNDNDSDFIPTESEEKPPKVGPRTTRVSKRKRSKQDTVQQQGLYMPRVQPKAESDPEPASEAVHEPLSEFEAPTEPEQTETEDDDENFKPRSKSTKGRCSAGDELLSHFAQNVKQIKKGASEPLPVDKKTPRKRGRPPKPRPVPAEGEELLPKRPYRKRIPDPSELLLKLRNVGRKPNTRKKLLGAERDAVKSKYAEFVSKGNPVANIVEKDQKVQAEGNCSSLTDGDDQDKIGLTVSQYSLSSQDPASASLSQQEELSSREKIRCKTCLCLFASGKFLKDHLNKVSAEDIFQCQACEMKFHGLIDLNMHVFCDHEYEKQPACFLCKEDFMSMEKLEKHLNCQHKGEPDLKLADTRFHDCRLCRMELNTDFQLIKNHYYRRHKAYVCPECYGKDVELLFYTDTHLYAEHKQMHAKSPAECAICQMVFPTAREMKAHMWTHADDVTEDGTGGKCSKCDKWLPNSGAMLMHEKEHKNEAIRKNYALEASIGFPCMKCEHIFSSKSNLKKHSCKADPNRTFYFHCEYCAHGCNTREQLRDHIALHHLGIKRYACDYCDQRFVCAPTLRRHIRRVHTKEKPYECHLCKERFYERNLMLRHVSKHTGIASFMCEFCGKGFHTKFDLKKHVENHTDSRDFVCPYCGLDYKRSYHLKRHLEKGCKRKFMSAADENVPSIISEVPTTAQEDADEMLYIDLAREINMEDDDNDADMDNYNDDSSGPDFGDDDDDDDDDDAD